MKLDYKKPELEFISFELNEAIASGCGLKVYNHATGTCQETTGQWNEIAGMVGANMTDDANCSNPLDGYCYYTSNGTGTFLFNSN